MPAATAELVARQHCESPLRTATLPPMRTADFHYDLPPELIAQHPGAERDGSRLLVLHRQTGQVEHRVFQDFLQYLRAGDVVVFNNSKVIPARLRGINARSGGHFELLLVEEAGLNDWWAMVRPGKRARVGTNILLLDPAGNTSAVSARVIGTNAEGHRRVQFTGTNNILGELDHLGEVPLPPYIVRPAPDRSPDAAADRERYQTVFAGPPGSVAAPTAGLHFTQPLLERVKELGVETAFVTLHVGPGTFAPVKADTLDAHQMHEERYELTQATVQTIERARQRGGRVVAVGTTTVRVLESVAAAQSTGRLSQVPDEPVSSFIRRTSSGSSITCSRTFICPAPPCSCW